MISGALVIDGHMDTPLRMVDQGIDIGVRLGDGHVDLVRLEGGGVDGVFLAAWVDPATPPGERMARAERLLTTVRQTAEAHPDRAVFAETAEEVRQAAATGRIALLAGVENGDALDGDVGNAVRLRELGARYLTLTWMASNGFADAAGGQRLHGGLSVAGQELIVELERLGVLVDLAHASAETFWAVLERTQVPIVVSHSATEARGPHPRNLSDSQLRGLAETGGLVGINFFPRYLVPGAERCHWTVIVDHLERAVQVAGPDHVALGSDLDGIPRLPDGFSGAQDFPRLAAELERRGFGDKDLRKIMGENWLRVLEAVDRHPSRQS